MIKRKTADRADWQRVTQRRFAMLPVDYAGFTGHISLLCIDAVNEPLWVESNSQRVCIADARHSWLHQIPHNTQHVVTTMFDAQGQIIQWYIDICAQTGVNARGIPWFDDLFLDLVVTPNGQVGLYDADELEVALAVGAISSAQYELAWTEARHLMHTIELGDYPLLNLSRQHRRQLLELI